MARGQPPTPKRKLVPAERLERIRELLEANGIDRRRQDAMAKWYWKKGGAAGEVAPKRRLLRERIADLHVLLMQTKRFHEALHKLLDPVKCRNSDVAASPLCTSEHPVLREHLRTWELLANEVAQARDQHEFATLEWESDPDLPETNRASVLRTLQRLSDEFEERRHYTRWLGGSVSDLLRDTLTQKDMAFFLISLRDGVPATPHSEKKAFDRFKIDLSQLRAKEDREAAKARVERADEGIKLHPRSGRPKTEKARYALFAKAMAERRMRAREETALARKRRAGRASSR